MVADQNVWLTQDMIATLYDKGRSTITEHLKNIYSDGELDEESTRWNFRRVASNGKEYNMNYFSLEAVIAKAFAESEFEKYRVIQDRLFESDFDKFAKGLKIW